MEDIEDQVDVTWGAVEVQVDGEFVTVEASVDLGVSEVLARFLGTVSPLSAPVPEMAICANVGGLPDARGSRSDHGSNGGSDVSGRTDTDHGPHTRADIDTGTRGDRGSSASANNCARADRGDE